MSQKLSVMESIEQMQKDMAIVESIVNDTIGEQKAAEDELQASYSPVDEDSWTSVVVSDTDDKQPRLYTTPVEEMTDAEKSMVISDFAKIIRDLHKETITLADIGPIATVIKDNRGLKQNVEEFIKNAILQSAENQDNAKYARAGQSTGANMVEGKPAPTEADAKVASPATGAGAFGAASVGAPEGMTADAPVPAAEEPAPEVDPDAADLAAVPGIDGGSDFEEAPITSLGGDLAPTDEVKEEVPAEAEPVEEVPAVDAPVTDETTPIDEEAPAEEAAPADEPAPAEEAPAEEAAPVEEEETAVEETEETKDGEKKEDVEEEDEKVFESIKKKMTEACKGKNCNEAAEKALRARLEAIAADYHRKEERKKLLESAINNAKKSIRESSEEKKRTKRAAIAKAINEAREAISKEKAARDEKDKAAKRAAIAKAINEAREENAKRAAIAEAIAKAKRSVMEGEEDGDVDMECRGKGCAKVECGDKVKERREGIADAIKGFLSKKAKTDAVSNVPGMPKSGLIGGGVKELNADYVKKAEALRKARIAQAVADAKSKKFELDLTKKKLMEANKRYNKAVAEASLKKLQDDVKEQGMKKKILDECDN